MELMRWRMMREAETLKGGDSFFHQLSNGCLVSLKALYHLKNNTDRSLVRVI
jgi:hypothetical protein